jgi:hypothetical protein
MNVVRDLRLLSCLLTWSCGVVAETGEDESLGNKRFVVVSFKVILSDGLFGEWVPDDVRFSEHAEGYFGVRPTGGTEQAPAEWIASQEINKGTSTRFLLGYGPLPTKPGVVARLLGAVQLPSRICGEFVAMRNHRLTAEDVSVAVTSSCPYVPIPEDGAAIPEIELTIDHVSALWITETDGQSARFWQVLLD